MHDRIAKHCIPSTHGNMYWKQWDKVSQTQNGRTQRIGNVAIEIDRLCECMDISEGSKLQKFLDAMHPELRLQVEPKIDKKQFDWEAVVSDAERCDDALFQAGKYGRGGKDTESFAVQHHPGQHKNNRKRGGPRDGKKTYPPRRGDKKQYEERKQNRQCYFCGKDGHFIDKCLARKHKERTEGGQQKPSSHSMELAQEPETLEECLETLGISFTQPTHMAIVLKVGGKDTRVLLDTGTVGTNLMALNWAQTNKIPTTENEKPTEIRMAIKNSKATANFSAKAEVEVGKGRRIECSFLLVPIGAYDIILGMPFLTKANIILDPGSAKATFKDHDTTLRCSATAEISATAATVTPQNEGQTTPDHLEFLRTLRNAITLSTRTLENLIGMRKFMELHRSCGMLEL